MPSNKIKNIVIYGTGGVGGYFGGKLAYYCRNYEFEEAKVYFIARGPHLEAIRSGGLILDSSEGIFTCRPEAASDKLKDFPKPDLVLLCVKVYDLDAASRDIAGSAGPGTVILPLLNGPDITARIRQAYSGIVLPACVYIGTHIEKPGTVRQRGGEAKILFGPDPMHEDYRAAGLMDIFGKAGIKYEWQADPFPAIWEKYLFISAYGLVTAYSKKSIGEVLRDPGLKMMVRSIMNEIKAISDKKGITLDPGIIERVLDKAVSFPYETRTSYQRDVERGGKNEGESFGGAILRLAAQYGIEAPVTEKVYSGINL